MGDSTRTRIWILLAAAFPLLLLVFYFFSEGHPSLVETYRTVPLPAEVKDHPENLIWLVAFVGLVTASLVEWAKEMLDWRSQFQESMVEDWLNRRLRVNERMNASAKSTKDQSDQTNDPDGIWQRLKKSRRSDATPIRDLHRIMGGEDYLHEMVEGRGVAAYSLPAEKLCGQIAAAAEIALNEPTRTIYLGWVLAGVSETEFDDYTSLVDRSSLSEQVPETLLKLRAKFTANVQRALDSFQIQLGQAWRRQLTIGCLWVSFAFSCLTVILQFLDSDAAPISLSRVALAILTIMTLTVAGALVAPVAHNAMRTIRSLGRS